MPKKKTAFINPFLSEFLYTCLYNVTKDQRQKLSNATLKILSSSTRAKNFCIHSSDDEKKKVLTELGVEWATVIVPKGVKSVQELKQMLVKVEQGRIASGVEHLVREKIFITTDKQTQFILGLAGQTISHKNYFLNLDLQKVGHVLKRWGKRVADGRNDELSESEEFADLIDGLISNSINSAYYAEGLLGITESQLLILFHLCRNRHLYVSKESIIAHYRGSLKGTTITTAIKKLETGNYIRKHINNSPLKYTITAPGIELIIRFRNRVMSNVR